MSMTFTVPLNWWSFALGAVFGWATLFALAVVLFVRGNSRA